MLEEIVVTARKREESLQDTPISVTAFSGDALEAQKIDNLDAIASFTHFSNGGVLMTRLGWRYRTEVNKDALNLPSVAQDDLHLLDAVITYTAPGGNWDISAFGKNITDER